MVRNMTCLLVQGAAVSGEWVSRAVVVISWSGPVGRIAAMGRLTMGIIAQWSGDCQGDVLQAGSKNRPSLLGLPTCPVDFRG
jgi:hypothetical protein